MPSLSKQNTQQKISHCMASSGKQWKQQWQSSLRPCQGLLRRCFVEFGAVVVQNETSIMNKREREKSNDDSCTYSVWTDTKMRKHSISYVRRFDSTIVAVLCFRNLLCAGSGCLMLFLFASIYGCYLFHDLPTPKIAPSQNERWANGPVNAYVQLSQRTLSSSSSKNQ